MTRHPLSVRRAAALVATLASLLGGACLGPPERRRENAPDDSPSTPPSFADSGPGAELVARDASGEPWPLDALPRRPRIEVVAAWSPEGRPAIFLFEKGPDAALLADLARSPLLVAHAARLVPASLHATTEGTVIAPAAPLALGARYAVGVAAWAVDAEGRPVDTPAVHGVRVAEAGAGAVVLETWPAAGTYGVPPLIPSFAVRFDDVIEGVGGIRVTTEQGVLIDAPPVARPCAELLLGPGHCVALAPASPLPPNTALRIEIDASVLDRTGAPVGPLTADLRTGQQGELGAAPALEPLVCALDEQPIEGACALAFDTEVRVRARASGPVRAALSVAGGRAVATSAPRGDFTLVLRGLAAGSSNPASLTLSALDGSTATIALTFETEADLPRVFVTEVRADPEGPEPDQEYVEVHNASDVTIDLAGFRITDDPEKPGDVIPPPALLPARGYALLVGSAFDPEGPADDAVPPGIPLFRLDASIAGGGLTNEGEPVFLRDAAGRRISGAPALASPGSGVCIVRATSQGRSADARSFAPHAEGRCGPGRPDPAAEP